MPMGRVVRRAGMTVKRLRGVRREGGPASLPPDQHWDVRNFEPEGGDLVPRGGQSKLNAALLPNVPATEFFNGMFDVVVGGSSVGGCGGGGGMPIGEVEGPKLYWGNGGGASGGSAGNPNSSPYVNFWDKEKSDPDGYNTFRINNVGILDVDIPIYTTPVDSFLFATHAPPVLWNGELWFSVYSTYTEAAPPFASESGGHGFFSMPLASGAHRPPLTKRLIIPPTAGAGVAGPVYQFVGMRPWRGKLYFNRWLWAGTSGLAAKTYSYDGVTAPVEVDTSPTSAGTYPRGVLYDFKDSIYVAYSDLPNIVRRITAAGATSSMGMPAAAFTIGHSGGAGATNSGYDCFAVYNGALYLCGWDSTSGGVIYKSTDGANFTLERVPTATGDVIGLRVFNGYLYYIYATARTNPATVRLGRYLASTNTWTDNHKDFGSNLFDHLRLLHLQDVAKEWLVVVAGAVVNDDLNVRSDLTDTTTWTQLQDNVPAGNALAVDTRCTAVPNY